MAQGCIFFSVVLFQFGKCSTFSGITTNKMCFVGNFTLVRESDRDYICKIKIKWHLEKQATVQLQTWQKSGNSTIDSLQKLKSKKYLKTCITRYSHPTRCRRWSHSGARGSSLQGVSIYLNINENQTVLNNIDSNIIMDNIVTQRLPHLFSNFRSYS